MNNLKEKFLIILSAAAIGISIGSYFALNKSINEIQIQGNNPGPLGGITRVAVGTGVKWTTDLIPSASFTVNLGSLTLPVNNYFGVGASLSGNLNFLGELKPDGALCSNGEILKKTGTNDWDCATDATGASAKAFGWIDANNSGGTFVSIGSISFDASHFTFSNTASLGYLRLDWGDGGPASLSENETISGNWVNTASPWDISTETNLTAGTDLTLTNDDLTLDSTLTQNFTLSATNTAISVTNHGLFGRASISTNFEVLGYASVSGKFTQGSVASNSFLGSLTGPTTGTLSVGTSNNYLKILWSNIVRAITRFIQPTGTSTTTTADAGERFTNTSSKSEEFNDGTTSRSTGPCDRYISYVLKGTDISAKNQWTLLTARDPFRLTEVSVTASGSNSATIQWLTGSATVPATSIMTHQASGSGITTYSSFTTASISDGYKFDIRVTSASATLESIYITNCLQYDVTEN